MPWQDGTPLDQQPPGQGWRAGQPLDQTPAPLTPAVASAPPPQGGGGWFTGGDQPSWLNQNATPSLGQASVFEKPADVSMNDFMLAHLAELGKGAGQIGGAASDYARVAANTFGLGDRALAAAKVQGFQPTASGQWVAGGDVQDLQAAQDKALAEERAKTAAASERLGPAASAAASMTGYGPLGALGIAGRLGGGVMGTAAEGGLATGAGALGEGDDLTTAALKAGAGTVGGAGLGALTKYVVNPLVATGANWFGRATGMLSKPADVTDALEKAKNLAYLPTHSIGFDALPLDQAYRTATSGLGKDQVAGLSPGFKSAVQDHLDQIGNGVPTSASEVDGFMRGLDEAGSTNADSVLAGRIKENLQGVLETTPPLTGQAPGEAADLIAKARAAHQQYSNARDLQQMSENLTGFHASPAGQAKSIAQQFYPDPNSPEYQALSNIVLKAGGGGMGATNVMHGVVDPALGYLGASIGGGPGAMAGEAVGHLLKPTIGGILGGVQRGTIQRAIGGAYPALTGASPTLWSPDLSPAARALLFGKAASSGY